MGNLCRSEAKGMVINMNYYDVFGISPTATLEDISAAHKALAKMYHPDVNDSEDAHTKMAMLNEANAVLSDTVKREKYDGDLRRTWQQRQNQEIRSSKVSETERTRGMMGAEERARKAELLSRRVETRLKTEAAAKKLRMEQVQQKAEETTKKNKQAKVESDKQSVINGLSALVMGDTLKRHNKMDVDEERYYATKVLLSMVQNNDKHLRRSAEEAERKQRIEEILTLVEEYNNKKEWV